MKSWWFRTIRHPILTEYWKQFYQKSKKVVPDLIKEYLNPLTLAVWIMDDGCYNHKAIDISTYSFNQKDIGKLQDALRENFGLISKVRKDRDKGYRLYFSVSGTRMLVKIIRPLIVPSMLYKVGFPINPVTTDVLMMHQD